LQAIFGGFMREAQQTARSLLHWWIFCIDMQKTLDYRAPLCSLQGIKIHFCEFLYDYALKRNKLPGEETAGFPKPAWFWETLTGLVRKPGRLPRAPRAAMMPAGFGT
jgi:hypothetical protein